MRFDRLTITNFLGMRTLALDLTPSKIHLFCGPNEAGKSTVAEAVRLALVGDNPRVRLKKDYKHLVTRGERKGIVTLQYDGGVLTRDVATGSTEDSQAKLTGTQELSARVAVGAQAFADLEVDDRRRLLFDLTQVNLGEEAIAARMAEEPWSVDAEVIKRLRPLLKASVQAAHKAAKDEVSRLRLMWQNLTGEQYGTEKSKSWEPKWQGGVPICTSEEDMVTIRAKVDKLQKALEESIREAGRAEGARVAKVQFEDKIAKVQLLARNIGTLEKDIASYEREQSDATSVIELNTELIEKAQIAARALSCPSCDTALIVMEDGELGFADPEKMDFRADAERIEELAQEIRNAQVQLGKAESELTRLRAQLAAASQATALVQDLQSKINVLGSTDVDGANNKVEKARSDIDQARRNLESAEGDNKAVQGAIAKKKQAKGTDELMRRWQRGADALDTDGIPAELLTKALDVINVRMRASAALAGWRAPAITGEMEIVRDDGLLYGLLSESARWRISAVVADAIASLSGMRVLILDRMDILDLPGRAQLVNWLMKLAADEYDSILVMATLKEAPTKLGADVAVHWLEATTITEEAAA